MTYEFGYEEAAALANERLDEAGFGEKTLEEMGLPDNTHAWNGEGNPIPVAIMGDREAPLVVLHPTPYLTRLDPHFKLRLQAQQTALGPEICVVGVGAYDPVGLPLEKNERQLAKKGDFTPLAARVLRAGESLELNDGQQAVLYGYSMGADIATQTAHDMLNNSNRGSFELAALGAAEAARMLQRGAIAVTGAMDKSGKKLFDNIVASNVPALLEAWGIDPSSGPDASKKALDKKVKASAVRYTLDNIPGSLALMRGFGTDVSARQLTDIMQLTELPLMIARQRDSLVFPAAVMEQFRDLQPDESVLLHVEDNDHSGDDNIRKSAARILYFAANLTP